MNIQKLKMAQAAFLAQYPEGFADPGLAPIRKKHNVDKLTEFAQANLTGSPNGLSSRQSPITLPRRRKLS
ncbi:MAG: hypothetical protein V7746_25830 [Halioglobus sp.]